ncbi:MAG: hypothetical protein UX09_C0033G0003 [Candidatus Uhrbacteria bacterium GW2011_GWE2_45_35]|uniref:Uncharacterized protein n=2 Tax=Candidatus Uhriibacteriota TaxID=1752732 RepID=A0A0G1MD18_9BACT|nr:MAG: hypothetical protein UW63_C0044G0004 [Candidatus Uhrbacteria bacterium GW2011_GWF2_44_350]KKU07210.1 MAG: hypothetical protein UX09_C0033G0003 [Candidatus Uhrbacteria bacterium GW2011_GWE2_45_35]HBR80624.1 hypothetical protein [Candidatus Uhrbacteria bacterium]HCU31942.1 hypothetical protein [Candidatus Uhrbacteria bacterium]
MNTTISIGTAKLITETLWHVLFFPIWWYTRGLAAVLRFAGGSIKNQYVNLGLGVWLTNLFVPMYGINDLAGRAISFVVRLFMIVVRGLALLVWIIIIFLVVIFYLLLLPISVAGFLYHFFGFLAPSLYVLS